ncbi:MAG: hypothetical protein JSV95_06245 [Gemmatimonadota bacterium]|jgi:hypothetical protein|nr:MAG: hypothetical protein JSV95_06245 [Gemmatimonadota bacterium]
MTVRIGPLSAAALLLACASALHASDTTFVRQGERVRLKLEELTPIYDESGSVWFRWRSVQRTGEATGIASDTLVFLPEQADAPERIPLSAITAMEVSEGRRSNPGKGAWIGALAGAAAGFGVGAAVQCGEVAQGACMLLGAGMGAGGGALLGLGVGAAITTERWVEAELPPPSPLALDIGLGASVRLSVSLRP